MDPLKILFDVIKTGLSQIFGVQYCGLLPKRRDTIDLPAIVIGLVELEPGEDPGTNELALISHWEARILVSDAMEPSSLWALVQAIMLWLFNYPWPETRIGRAHLKQAGPDQFSPEYQGHDIWLIEWTQTIRVGDSVWDGSGVIPSTLSIGGLDAERQDIEV